MEAFTKINWGTNFINFVSFLEKVDKKWIIFIFVCLAYMALRLVANTYIFTDQIFYRSYSDQLTQQSIEGLLNIRERIWWMDYVFQPVLLLIKFCFVSICISIGLVLSDIKFSFSLVFKSTLLAEIVFIMAQVLYLINLSFHLDTLTLETAASYYPLTMLSFFGTENVVQWLQYPLETLNLFEVAYMVVIGWLLSRQWEKDFSESMLVVIPSYITGLLLWLVFVIFITLQIS
ncbi:hypothetical protein [Fodinibius saliphilus]|uniref:hypothetical protein n=1 Tax=Fodinibius saliphilus TaxID=1920650 RepID=UPI001108848B|nr:hypothetical protein [Fodinibius saliphilus]